MAARGLTQRNLPKAKGIAAEVKASASRMERGKLTNKMLRGAKRGKRAFTGAMPRMRGR